MLLFVNMASETKREKTRVCCLDLDEDCLNLLKDRFDVYDGSLGKPIDVSGKNHGGLNLLLNYELPQNIHEYDIFIEDMIRPDRIPYNTEENTRTEILGSKHIILSVMLRKQYLIHAHMVVQF